MQKLIPSVAIMLIGSASLAGPIPSPEPALKFRISIRNVTAANVLSPPLAVVQRNHHPLFELGSPASPGIAELAETGSTQTLESELAASTDLVLISKAEGGPIFAGNSRTIDISIQKHAIRHDVELSLIAMIGKSNDSFISLRGVSLFSLSHLKPEHPPLRISATNYDAGSEENTGNVEDFGPAGHPVEHAEGHISIDRGLNPKGNAPEILGWGQVAAEIKIERLP